MAESTIVKKQATSHLLTATKEVAIHTELLWHSVDPLTVLVTFRRNQQWLIGRDLLLAGMSGLAGDPRGDVHVSPFDELGTDLCLRLSSPSGRATFRLDADFVGGFLEQTLAIVPLGEESYDLDAEAEVWFGVES